MDPRTGNFVAFFPGVTSFTLLSAYFIGRKFFGEFLDRGDVIWMIMFLYWLPQLLAFIGLFSAILASCKRDIYLCYLLSLFILITSWILRM